MESIIAVFFGWPPGFLRGYGALLHAVGCGSKSEQFGATSDGSLRFRMELYCLLVYSVPRCEFLAVVIRDLDGMRRAVALVDDMEAREHVDLYLNSWR